MQYIDAEKLIAEIEKQLSAHDKVDHLEAFEVGKAWNRGHRNALENILSFIDSLQQEQPEVDLGKEFDDYLESVRAFEKDDYVIEYKNGDAFNHSYDIFPLARHFYELRFNTRKEDKK